MPLNYIFPAYFLMVMDSHGIKITEGLEHLHGQTIADEFRGQENRAQAMRDKYGDDFYLKPRSRKHRYVFFVGSKSFKKKAANALKYKIESYP